MIVNIVQFVQKMLLQNLVPPENWPKCARKIWNMLENIWNFFKKQQEVVSKSPSGGKWI